MFKLIRRMEENGGEWRKMEENGEWIMCFPLQPKSIGKSSLNEFFICPICCLP
jgi:hypothetical protein